MSDGAGVRFHVSADGVFANVDDLVLLWLEHGCDDDKVGEMLQRLAKLRVD